jgi:hypothetical protein
LVLMAVDKAGLAKQLQRAEQQCAGLQSEVGGLGACIMREQQLATFVGPLHTASPFLTVHASIKACAV